MIKSTLLWVFFILVSVTGFAQQEPAVTARDMSPTPIPVVNGVPSSFTLAFTLGNFGTVPITGANAAEKMQFKVRFSDSRPLPQSTAALSGEILNWFDITYDPAENAFNGIQKQDFVIDPNLGPYYGVTSLSIVSEVTSATATSASNTIGGSMTIIPNSAATSNNTENDFASIYTHTTQVVLPVSLVSFVAEAKEDRTVLVQWKTSWESNNKGYVVERSKDLLAFEKVGEVNDVAGTSNSINQYQFVDTSPYRGRSYYRLRQLDLDGKSQTYKAEAVEIDGRYGVYPNPIASSQFTLELDEPSTSTLRMYSPNGSEVQLNKSDIKETSLKVSPNTKLSAGVYVLTVEERGVVRKHRLVVQ